MLFFVSQTAFEGDASAAEACALRTRPAMPHKMAEVLRFLSTLNKNPGSSEEAQMHMLEACLSDIRAGPKMSMGDATTVLEDLEASDLPRGVKDKVVACVQDMATCSLQDTSETAKKQGNKVNQRALGFQDFFVQPEWDDLTSCRTEMNSKMKVIAKRMCLLGMKYACEKTYVLATAMLLLCTHQGPPQDLEVNAKHAYGVLLDLKTVCRAMTKSYADSSIRLYPQRPEDLPGSLFRAAYATNPPVACPLDGFALKSLSQQLAARKSHASISRTISIGARAHGKQMSLAGMDMQQLMQGAAVLSQMFQNQQAGAGECNISFLHGNSKPKRAAKALCDGPAETLQQEETAAAAKETCAEEPRAKEPCAEERCPAKEPEVSTPASKRQAKADLDTMASAIGKQLALGKQPKEKVEDTPGPKEKKPLKTTPKKTVAKAKATKTIKTGSKLSGYPGISKKPPQYLASCTIYTTHESWRVKPAGSKLDKAFRFGDKPKAAWKDLAEYVAKLA